MYVCMYITFYTHVSIKLYIERKEKLDKKCIYIFEGENMYIS